MPDLPNSRSRVHHITLNDEKGQWSAWSSEHGYISGDDRVVLVAVKDWMGAELPRLLNDAMIERAARQMMDEFNGWMDDHPRVALFDWRVAAENALRAAFSTSSEETDRG